MKIFQYVWEGFIFWCFCFYLFQNCSPALQSSVKMFFHRSREESKYALSIKVQKNTLILAMFIVKLFFFFGGGGGGEGRKWFFFFFFCGPPVGVPTSAWPSWWVMTVFAPMEIYYCMFPEKKRLGCPPSHLHELSHRLPCHNLLTHHALSASFCSSPQGAIFVSSRNPNNNFITYF